MLILALETTSLIASIAVARDEKILGEINLNSGYTHSQVLLPMINNLLELLKINVHEINYIACSSGPGSFTGLKIGAATAKAFAHALNKKIISVLTLDSLAFNIAQIFNKHEKIIIPMIDARGGFVYAAIYKTQDNIYGFEKLTDYLYINHEEIINLACEFKQEIILTGDCFDKNIIKNCELASQNIALQSASNISRLANIFARENKNIFSHKNFQPFYLKKSQAELNYNS